MPVRFNPNPGAWERQLQRQYGNPLFPPEQRDVTAVQLGAARRRDSEEQQSFHAALHATLREAMELPPQVDSEVLLKLKERLDQLYDQCAGLPGDRRAEQRSITRVIGVIMKAIRMGAGDDPQARAELEQEEAARRLHHELLEQPLIAHLLRPDSPIGADQLAPTLLSEGEAALQAALTLFDAAQLSELCAESRALLTRLRQEGHELPDEWRRLEQMEAEAHRQHLVESGRDTKL